MIETRLSALRETVSGHAAKRHVESIIQHHRIQASPGYRRAAEYCLRQLTEYGLEVEMVSFPARLGDRYWAQEMFEEWDVSEATLDLVDPEDQARRLADCRDLKLSVIQRTGSVDLEAPLLILDDGTEEEHYRDVDVKGALVLTRGEVPRVRDLAVHRRGAAGIVSDGLRRIPGQREPMDLPDARQYTSFWWTGEQTPCCGFVLSPRQGDELRRLARERALMGAGPLRVRAQVRSTFREGSMEVLSSLIPGTEADGGEEVLLIAHLCHPQWCANDNASGGGTLMETARALHSLIESGKLARPRRGIRFLLVPEMTGTLAYYCTREAERKRTIAALNLDMVGEDQSQCGSTLMAEYPPLSSLRFPGHLLSAILERVMTDQQGHSGQGHYSSKRWAPVPFNGGSDHYILSDPSVGIPCCQIIQWPDRFYHTSMDTLDKVDPHMLWRVGVVAGTFVHLLAGAGPSEVSWLGWESVARTKREILRRLALEGHSAQLLVDPPLERDRLSFLAQREAASLEALSSLGEGKVNLSSLAQEIVEFAKRESELAPAVASYGPEVGGNPPQQPSEEDASRPANSGEAPLFDDAPSLDVIPIRKVPAPVPLRLFLLSLPEERRDTWYRAVKEDPVGKGLTADQALFWADGNRPLEEIARLVQLETGRIEVALISGYMLLLAQLGFVELKTP